MARQAAHGAHTGARVGPTVEFKVHFRKGEKGRKRLGQNPRRIPKPVEPGRIPRISRLLALAIRFDKLIREGAVQDYADLARLGRVSRARISQIMDLLNLAPSIQEEILFMPPALEGRDVVTERRLRGIVAEMDWSGQSRMWETAPLPLCAGPLSGDVDRGSNATPLPLCCKS